MARQQKQIDKLKKQLDSKPTPSPSEAFSVQPEHELSSFGMPDKFTGFFAGYQTKDGGFSLIPLTHVVFVRVTNLLPTKTMIRRLDVSLDRCDSNNRIDTTMGTEVFLEGSREKLPPHPTTGGHLIFRGGGTDKSLILVDVSKPELSGASQLDLPLLDRLLSDRYLDAGETIGGWVLFSSRCVGAIENFSLEDVAGRKFSYHSEVGSRDDRDTNDLSNSRIMTIGNIVDLSGATIQAIR